MKKRILRLLYRNDDWMYALYEDERSGELILHSLCGQQGARYDVYLRLSPDDRAYYLEQPFALNYLASGVCDSEGTFASQLIDLNPRTTRFVE